MPTGVLTSIAGAAAGSAASFGLSKLFGGGGGNKDATQPLQTFQPTGINAGGLGTSIDADGNIVVTPSGNRMGQVNQLADTFARQTGAIGGLLPRVAPGMSDLRKARLAEIENARIAAVGNLRDNLARRRVLGSSFAQDVISRADAEFDLQKQQAAAESFLQEMEMTTNLINQQFTAWRGLYQTNLDEMNLETNVAVGLAGKATDVLGKNAQVESMLNAKANEGAGTFMGQLIQPVGAAVGKAVGGLDFGKMFGGGGGGVLPGGLPLGMGGIGSA